MKTIKSRLLAPVCLVAVLFFGLAPVISADSGESSPQPTTREQLESELRVLLIKRIAMLMNKTGQPPIQAAATGEHTEDEAVSQTLKVWVEVHSYKTHVHVQKPGEQATSFILEDIKYTDEAAIVDAVVKTTGLLKEDVAEVITFPSGELNEKGDSVEPGSTTNDQDVAGIHIMSNGKVMWGNGVEVVGAVILADGNVKLSDGRVIKPKFDLR